MNIKKTAAFALTLALGACLFAGCAKGPAGVVDDPNNPPTPSGDGTFTITLHANGGSFGNGETVTRETGTNGRLTVADLTTPTYDGHTFFGWNVKADGSGDPITLAKVYTANTVIYAQWDDDAENPPTPTGVYKITFDANGGSWAGAMPDVTTVNGRIVAMPTEEPTRAGYEFKGWNLEMNGSGPDVSTAIEFSAPTTVYAKWGDAVPANDPTVGPISASGVWLVGEGLAGGGWDDGVQFTAKGDGTYVLYMTVSSSKWIKVRGGEYFESGNSTLVNTDSTIASTDDDGYGGTNIIVRTPGRYKFTYDGNATTIEAL